LSVAHALQKSNWLGQCCEISSLVFKLLQVARL
jgi:hypothetical protein